MAASRRARRAVKPRPAQGRRRRRHAGAPAPAGACSPVRASSAGGAKDAEAEILVSELRPGPCSSTSTSSAAASRPSSGSWPLPDPVVVCGAAAEHSEAALAAGAVDVVGALDVPAGSPQYVTSSRRHLRVASRVRVITHPRARLRGRVRAASRPPVRRPPPARSATRHVRSSPSAPRPAARPRWPRSWATCPPTCVPVVVVQHMAEGFVEGLARWLDGVCPLPVVVAEHGERLRPGAVHVAPAGDNLLVGPGCGSSSREPPPSQFHVPGVDATFVSVAAGVRRRPPSVCCSPAWAATAPSGCARCATPARSPSARTRRPAWCGACPPPRRRSDAVEVELPLPEIAAAIVEAVARACRPDGRPSEGRASLCATPTSGAAPRASCADRRAGVRREPPDVLSRGHGGPARGDRRERTWRRTSCGLDRPAGAAERQRLLDAVTIQETHFFRARPQMEALRRRLLPELLAAGRARGTQASPSGAPAARPARSRTRSRCSRSRPPSGWLTPPARPRGRGDRRVDRGARRRPGGARYAGRTVDLAEPRRGRALVRPDDDGGARGADEVRELVEFAHHNLVTDAAAVRSRRRSTSWCAATSRSTSPARRREALVGRFRDAPGRRGLAADRARGDALAGDRCLHPGARRRGLRLSPGGRRCGRARAQRPPRRPARRPARPLAPRRDAVRPVRVGPPTPRRRAAPSGAQLLASGARGTRGRRYAEAAALAERAVGLTRCSPRRTSSAVRRARHGPGRRGPAAAGRAVYLDQHAGDAWFLLAGSLARTGDRRGSRTGLSGCGGGLRHAPVEAVRGLLDGAPVAQLVQLCRRLADDLEGRADRRRRGA